MDTQPKEQKCGSRSEECRTLWTCISSVEKKWRGQPRRRIHEAKNALWERHSRYAQVLGHYTHTGWPAGRSLSNNSIMTLLLILVMIWASTFFWNKNSLWVFWKEFFFYRLLFHSIKNGSGKTSSNGRVNARRRLCVSIGEDICLLRKHCSRTEWTRCVNVAATVKPGGAELGDFPQALLDRCLSSNQLPTQCPNVIRSHPKWLAGSRC